jgi:hypothetical protein
MILITLYIIGWSRSLVTDFEECVKYYSFLTSFRKSNNYEEIFSNVAPHIALSAIVGATNLLLFRKKNGLLRGFTE